MRARSAPVYLSVLVCLFACSRQPPALPHVDLGAGGVLLVSQSRFQTDSLNKPIPQPARLELLRFSGGALRREVLEDPLSNVFHKAMIVASDRDTSLFTIGGDAAALTRWKTGRVPSEPQRIWQPTFGGKHDRIRDIERGDVDGDGVAELVMATHDQGVVAVADQGADEAWQVSVVDSAPGTFVHEVEVGDLDRDGLAEFYATPSKPNLASGASQPGSVVRFSWDGARYVRTVVDSFPDTHAKEILVADVDGNGDELYVVKEASTTAEGEVIAPVSIVRYQLVGQAWQKEEVCTIPDKQCRFLLSTDLDGDGAAELVAAGFRSGIWWITPTATVPWRRELIDRESSGFEHACTAADMDGDGLQELYVASDDQKEVRRYVRTDGRFHRTVLAPMEGDFITWGLTAGRM